MKPTHKMRSTETSCEIAHRYKLVGDAMIERMIHPGRFAKINENPKRITAREVLFLFGVVLCLGALASTFAYLLP